MQTVLLLITSVHQWYEHDFTRARLINNTRARRLICTAYHQKSPDYDMFRPLRAVMHQHTNIHCPIPLSEHRMMHELMR